MASPSLTPRPRRTTLTRKHLTLIPCGPDEPAPGHPPSSRRKAALPRPSRHDGPGRPPAHREPSPSGAPDPVLARRSPDRAPSRHGDPARPESSGAPRSGGLTRRRPSGDAAEQNTPDRHRTRRGPAGDRPSPRGGKRQGPHRRAHQTGQATGPVRLTRRGKCAVTFAITALTFGAFWLGTQQGARADQVPTCGSQVVTTGGDAAHRASLRR